MQNRLALPGVWSTLYLAVLLASGCQSRPEAYRESHPPMKTEGAHYFSGGIETESGFFEYLAFSTHLRIGGYQPPPQQHFMSSTAPSGDIPWITLPDGWIYWTGDSGCIGTEVGTTCASGSTMIIQRFVQVNGKQCDRFIMLRTHRAKSGFVKVARDGKTINYIGKSASWIDVPLDGSAPLGPFSFDDDPDAEAKLAPPPDIKQLLDAIKQARKQNHIP
jgi:hypothetical protein